MNGLINSHEQQLYKYLSVFLLGLQLLIIIVIDYPHLKNCHFLHIITELEPGEAKIETFLSSGLNTFIDQEVFKSYAKYSYFLYSFVFNTALILQ